MLKYVNYFKNAIINKIEDLDAGPIDFVFPPTLNSPLH